MNISDRIRILLYQLLEVFFPANSQKRHILKALSGRGNIKNIFKKKPISGKAVNAPDILEKECKKTVLVIDHKVPEPDKDAGSNTIFGYIAILRGLGLNVIFMPEDRKAAGSYYFNLIDMGVTVLYGSFNFKKWMAKNGKNIEMVLLSRPFTSFRVIDVIKKFYKGKIFYYMHDLHFLRKKRQYEISGNRKDLRDYLKTRAVERYVFKKSDYILTPSATEKDYLNRTGLDNIKVVQPYYYKSFIDKEKTAGSFLGRKDIVFLGSYEHDANVDGIIWFCREIFPIVRKSIGQIKLYIIGSNPSESVKSLQSDDIIVTGYVKDLNDYFASARVFIAPLRFGAGIKGKIITAMYYGVPVVGTSIGVEGIGMENGKNVLTADSADEFADKVVKLYSDKSLWSKISYNSMNLVESKYNKDNLALFFKELLEI